MPNNPRPALFLDRDGVLNEEVNYLHDPRDLVMIPGAAGVIADFNQRSIPVVVVTNQAGIGRGYYDAAAYESVNQAMALILAGAGAHVDAWYHCPHAPDEGCACRKPKPGLLHRAQADLGLDLMHSVLVGDKQSDLEAARAVGMKAILVRTGHGLEEEQRLQNQNRYAFYHSVHDSLAHAHRALQILFDLALGNST